MSHSKDGSFFLYFIWWFQKKVYFIMHTNFLYNKLYLKIHLFLIYANKKDTFL